MKQKKTLWWATALAALFVFTLVLGYAHAVTPTPLFTDGFESGDFSP